MINRKEILHPTAEAYILQLELMDMVHQNKIVELEAEILERAGHSLTRRLEADETIGKLKLQNHILKDQVQTLVTIMEKYPDGK